MVVVCDTVGVNSRQSWMPYSLEKLGDSVIVNSIRGCGILLTVVVMGRVPSLASG